MNPTYPYFRSPDQATFEALDAASFHDVVVVGTIYTGGEYGPDGEVITEPVAREGFHVNTSTFNEVPAEWEPYRIYPNKPQVKFAGDA